MRPTMLKLAAARALTSTTLYKLPGGMYTKYTPHQGKQERARRVRQMYNHTHIAGRV